MAKSKVKFPANKLELYKEAIKYSNVSFVKDRKSGQYEVVQLGEQIQAIVSFRDPYYLMEWERNVHLLEAQKTKKK